MWDSTNCIHVQYILLRVRTGEVERTRARLYLLQKSISEIWIAPPTSTRVSCCDPPCFVHTNVERVHTWVSNHPWRYHDGRALTFHPTLFANSYFATTSFLKYNFEGYRNALATIVKFPLEQPSIVPFSLKARHWIDPSDHNDHGKWHTRQWEEVVKWYMGHVYSELLQRAMDPFVSRKWDPSRR